MALIVVIMVTIIREYLNKLLHSESVLIILIIILLWRILNNNVVLILLIGYMVYTNYYKKKESFDKTGSEFVSKGSERYDLKGDLIRWRPVEYWIPQKYNSCCKY